MIFLDKKISSQFDWVLLSLAILLPILGLVVLYSAGYDSNVQAFSIDWLPSPISFHSVDFVKQATFFGMGFIALLVGLSVSTNILYRYAYLIYFICLCLLIAVLVVGTVSHGSKRWLNFGGLNLQPAELMKIGVMLALARYLSKAPKPSEGYGFVQLLIPVALVAIPMLLVIKQPDLGTSIAIGAVGFSLVLFMGVRLKILGILSVGGLISIFPAWHFILKPYQQRRILTLLNPEADPLGSGYHIIQSKIAVGSGQLFGKGFLGGTQTQLEFLPEHTTDFVFSVLAEEWGFIGSAAILTLYFLCIYRILTNVLRSKEIFPALICFGVAFSLFFHAIINLGMVIGLLPVVGIPLPLFSYGGSSVIVTLGSIGIVLGLGMRRLSFVAPR